MITSDGTLYTDSNVVIKHIENTIQCRWKSEVEINHSYMTAKLTEVIGNKFPGVWPVKDIGEAETSRGMRCFILKWEKDILTARWI